MPLFIFILKPKKNWFSFRFQYLQLMRFDASMESLINIGRSESFADLNNTEFGMTKSISFMGQPTHRDLFSSGHSMLLGFVYWRWKILKFVCFDKDSQSRDFAGRTRHSFGGKGTNDDTMGSAKQFGIGKCAHQSLFFFILLILWKNCSNYKKSREKFVPNFCNHFFSSFFFLSLNI